MAINGDSSSYQSWANRERDMATLSLAIYLFELFSTIVDWQMAFPLWLSLWLITAKHLPENCSNDEHKRVASKDAKPDVVRADEDATCVWKSLIKDVLHFELFTLNAMTTVFWSKSIRFIQTKLVARGVFERRQTDELLVVFKYLNISGERKKTNLGFSNYTRSKFRASKRNQKRTV